MNQLCEETLVTLREAARQQPSRYAGRSTSVSTIFRWATRGVRGQKLETVLIGGVRFTSKEALLRFFGRVNGAKVQVPVVDQVTPDSVVDAGLKAHGLLSDAAPNTKRHLGTTRRLSLERDDVNN